MGPLERSTVKYEVAVWRLSVNDAVVWESAGAAPRIIVEVVQGGRATRVHERTGPELLGDFAVAESGQVADEPDDRNMAEPSETSMTEPDQQDQQEQELSTEKGKGTLEGLRVNVVTAVAAGMIVVSASITVGLYMSKLTTLEGRIDLAERSRNEAVAAQAKFNQDLAILEARVKSVEKDQSDAKTKLDKIAGTLEAIGEMVLIMCQTSARPGVTCRTRQ